MSRRAGCHRPGNDHGDLTLEADNDINLLAARNVDEQNSDRSSFSYGAGLAIQFGEGGVALGVTANASGSRGNSDGRDTANTLTHLKAGGQALLDAGRDTSLIGATVAEGELVTLTVQVTLQPGGVVIREFPLRFGPDTQCRAAPGWQDMACQNAGY